MKIPLQGRRVSRRRASRKAREPKKLTLGAFLAVGMCLNAAALLRMLRLSRHDAIEIINDERDAFLKMAENLGWEPGLAEDLIDDFLEDSKEAILAAPVVPGVHGTQVIPNGTPPMAAPQPAKATQLQPAPVSNLTPGRERARHHAFSNSLGQPMLFIPAGSFVMGNNDRAAPPNEQPATKVALARLYMSRHPVTNAQYEMFDPSHLSKRGAWADDTHPVIHVSSLDAMRFCEWLGVKERKSYRLPTEAEWEYAARGVDGRSYPWGRMPQRSDLANFADCRTKFPWSDPFIDDGYAETSPVGSYPLGASPFGVEDMAGNVWEWCIDYYERYTGGELQNPTGPKSGANRVYRGGSWKSRFDSLRATCRGSNVPAYACNDLGFRIVCAI